MPNRIESDERKIEYEGYVCARSVGRGLTLWDGERSESGCSVEDMIQYHFGMNTESFGYSLYARMKITVELLNGPSVEPIAE